MFTATAAARPAQTATAKKVTVAMHIRVRLVRQRPGKSPHMEQDKDRDGASHPAQPRRGDLGHQGPEGTVKAKVGGTVLLKAKGVYRITMVKQASDDNHLKLTIN